MALTPTRSETAANWASSNPVLVFSEVGIESDTGVVKVGDGVRTWATLNVADNQSTSAQKSASTSDETGTGAQVYATSPTLVTPTLTSAILSSPALTAPTYSVANAITASATQTQVGATNLTKDINRVTTVATAGDAVKLPTATAGRRVTVINANVTNAVGVFPATGDAINAVAANGVSSLAAATTRIFSCAVTGTWNF